jgi:hypothetical protein
MMENKCTDDLDDGRTKLSDGIKQKLIAEFPGWADGLRDHRLWEKANRLWELFRKGGLSRTQLAAVVGALLYCVSPIDLTPDAIPVIGLIDDFLVAVSVLAYLEGHN